MNFTDYPDKCNFFELGYCGHPEYPHSKIFLNQASDVILSHFKEEDHSFIKDALRNKKIQLVLLYYVYRPNTNASRKKNTNDDEQAYKFCPLYGGESTSFHRHMISVVVFSYSETLISYDDENQWINLHIKDKIHKPVHHHSYFFPHYLLR